jgi:hypothetical protein
MTFESAADFRCDNGYYHARRVGIHEVPANGGFSFSNPEELAHNWMENVATSVESTTKVDNVAWFIKDALP